MVRRGWGLLVGNAILTGLVAVIASISLDEPLRDPEGFLGPAWIRLPAMVLGAFLIDVVPRAMWRSRRRPGTFLENARELVRNHWTRERLAAVAIGITSFYVTYVSYRNLKNYLPFIAAEPQDPLLHELDQLLFFGNEPAVVLHSIFGSGISAQVLAFIYLIYLPIVPLSVVAYLVWAKNISVGLWYATANCLCWTLGTVSYYLIPSMGPAFWYVWLYEDLDTTGVTALQDSLWNSRQDVRWDPFADSIQSVAGFASLHVAVILALALIVHYTVQQRWVRWTVWAFFWLTALSTLYFGWHYIADDLGGVVIAVLAVWLGGLATGQKFTRHGLAVEQTTDSAEVPVEPEGTADSAEDLGSAEPART